MNNTFNNKELQLLSDGVLRLMHDINKAYELIPVDEELMSALKAKNKELEALNTKVCSLMEDDEEGSE